MEDNKNNISHDQQQPPHPPFAHSQSSSSQSPSLSLPSQPILPPSSLQIPISHVKRIMRSDPDVVMVSGDAPVLLANMIRKPDVINALATHEPSGFLLDLFPKVEPVQLEPVAPSDSLDLTNVVDLTNMIQPPPNCVIGVPVYYPPPSGLVVVGTPVVYPAWPRILPPTMAGRDGADETGPSGTANDGGN